MSAFKRHQSKVFWDHMEAQDSEHSNSLSRDSTLKLQSLSEESFESSRDVTDNDGNVTVIQMYGRDVDAGTSERLDTFQDTSNTPRETVATVGTENTVTEENETYCARACSPVSQGHRSQDSGFSDSDRSECWDKDDNENCRRTQRRERRHKRWRSPKQLASLWTEEKTPPNPTHTSTPKNLSVDRKVKLGHNAVNISKTRWDLRHLESAEEENESIPITEYVNEESLGDFLFAVEPPEDESPCSISSQDRGKRKITQCSVDDTLLKADSTETTAKNESKDNIALKFGYLTSVRAWLNEISTEVDDECCSTLQSKTLPKQKMQQVFSEDSEAQKLKTLVFSAAAAATKLLVSVERFDQRYRSIHEHLLQLENVASDHELLRAVEKDASLLLSELGAPAPRRIRQGSLHNITKQLQHLKADVDDVIEPRLDFCIERVVRGLEEAPRENGSVARGAIAALTALGLAGVRAGNSIARCAGVRALLTSLVSSARLSSELRASSLRALASVCCCPAAIESFVKEDGPEILTDILGDKTCPISEKTEAAALVVQITAPWTNALGLPYMIPFADNLVRDLTQLAEETSCTQTLLLAAAALNNLSSSSKCVTPIIKCDTLKKLLQSVKRFVGGNVWLMEQVSSLIHKVARVPEARSYLVTARVSVALVSFLRMRPLGVEAAYRRLEATATAALTRLCVDPEIARQVVAVGGVDCLPVCKTEDTNLLDNEETSTLRYTKSFRIASKKAAEQINDAKNDDCNSLHC